MPPITPSKRKTRSKLLAAGLVALLSGCATQPLAQTRSAASVAPAAVLIEGGTIYDGGEGPPFVGDVALRGDRIVYVGPPRSIEARQTVNARGMIVTPGFIDPHTHADVFLRSASRSQRVNAAWLNQGVSTVVIGVDGGGTPEVADDAAKLTEAGVGTNVIPFVGFGAIRGRVLGSQSRAPDRQELAEMKRLVAKAMCEGARGLSTGLFYTPQSFATTEEVIAVAKEAARRGGIYDTHQRDESSYSIGLLGSVEEALRIGREAGMPVHFAHIKALGVDVQGYAPQLIAMIEAARRNGSEVTADQYPWLASGTSVEASLLPGWALAGGREALAKRLADPAQRRRIEEAMTESLRRRGGASSMLLTALNQPWTGKTLAQMADVWEVSPIDAAVRIIQAGLDKGGSGGDVASFNMAERDVELLMQQPWVITSSDGSNGHPRMFATYPEKYRKYVREKHTIDLGRFVRQSTGQVADIYKIDGRGYLKPGNYADVLVFDPDEFAPRADYLKPRELSVGVKALFVNGTMAVKDSSATGAAAGKVLLRTTVPDCR
ncbi:amidohydrolase family protein [Qipengyuania sp.]|uniref:N-acyl-D-amino-acid deacylase family protein n=1 Tax=Qipengyuania sp. TaxID=2004515 RepID=UPI0035C834CC